MSSCHRSCREDISCGQRGDKQKLAYLCWKRSWGVRKRWREDLYRVCVCERWPICGTTKETRQQTNFHFIDNVFSFILWIIIIFISEQKCLKWCCATFYSMTNTSIRWQKRYWSIVHFTPSLPSRNSWISKASHLTPLKEWNPVSWIF